MAFWKGGAKLAQRLKDLAAKLSGQKTLSVGFMSSATYPDGKSVALIAAIQEFGAPRRGIPPRPFFRNAVSKHKVHWGKDLAVLIKSNSNRNALELMGMEIKAEVQESITLLMSPPLSPKTIARKGSAKPLIETGHMLNSVEYEVR